MLNGISNEWRRARDQIVRAGSVGAVILGMAAAPHNAQACEPISSMAGRIGAGSPFGGTPCFPAGPSGVVRGTPGGLPGGISPQTVTGAIGALGTLFGATNPSRSSTNQPSAMAQKPPTAADVEFAEAYERRYRAQHCATMSLQDCANWVQRAENINAADCNGSTGLGPGTVARFGACLASQAWHSDYLELSRKITQTAPIINPADVPKVIDYGDNTIVLGNGQRRSVGPGNDAQDLNAQEPQGLCRAGQASACPGGVVQYGPR